MTEVLPCSSVEPARPRIELRQLGCPHPDIELGVARSHFAYLACLPDDGINVDTGLFQFLVGYGMEPCGSYVRSLLTYVANRYNCVAVSPDYFGANLWAPGKCKWVPHPEFFLNLKRYHGLDVSAPKGFDTRELADRLAKVLSGRGVKSLHPACLLLGVTSEYHSMGVLPALDGLRLAHHLIDEFALNKRRLFLLGTSYGGYVANLMTKFAPRTFRMVVDNSGFSSAEDDIWNVYGQSKWHFGNGFTINTQMIAAFSEEPTATSYFSPSRKNIRTLLDASQIFTGSARLYGYHPMFDAVAPTAAKQQLREVFAGKIPYELEIIDETMLDGRVFKSLAHGMNASMRGLFDRSYEKFLRDGGALADETDFDLHSSYLFACGAEDYLFRFSSQGVAAQLRRPSAA